MVTIKRDYEHPDGTLTITVETRPLEPELPVDGEVGTTAERFIVFLMWVVIVITGTLLPIFTIPIEVLRQIVGVLLFLGGLKLTVDNFFVSAGVLTGAITFNKFTYHYHTYATGLHIRFPWEDIVRGIELRQHVIECTEVFPGREGDVGFNLHIAYRPNTQLLPVYINHTKEQIAAELRPRIRAALAPHVAGITEREAHIKLIELQKALLPFQGAPSDSLGLGIIIDQIVIDVADEILLAAIRTAPATP